MTKYLFIIILLYNTVSFHGFAQPVKLWMVSEKAPGDARTSLQKLETDNEGNAILLCAYEKGNFDGTIIMVAKYSQDGKLQWRNTFQKAGFDKKNEVPADMKTDSNSNVYITGISYFENGSYHFITVKYDKTGKKIWESRFTEALANLAGREAKVLVNSNGDVYIVGVTAAKETERNGSVIAIKYNALGNRMWYKLLKEEEGYVPAPPVCCLDKNENLLISYRRNNKYNYEFPVTKLDTKGNVMYSRFYSSSLGEISERMSYALTVTQGGDVVSTSTVDLGDSYAIKTVWLSDNGDNKWQNKYEAPEKRLITSKSLAFDSKDNVYLIAQQNSRTSTISQLIACDKTGKTVLKTDLPYKEAENLIVFSNSETLISGFVPQQNDYFRNINAHYYITKYDSKGVRLWAANYPEEDGNTVSDAYHKCLIKKNKQNELFFAYEAAGQCNLLKFK